MRRATDELRRVGRQRLAAILDEAWDRGLAEHSAGLHVHRPRVPLEPALRDAFARILADRGLEPDVLASCLDDLERYRVLQTATHLTASEGPTFLAVHLVATAGLPPERPYLVGAFSGVPFANPAWSGCLNYSDRHPLEALIPPPAPCYREMFRNQNQRKRDSDERRISLIPGRLRDARLHRCPMPDKTREIVAQLVPALRNVLPSPVGDSFFADWALGACQAATAPLLGRTAPVVYFDLNRVIGAYLRVVLANGSHPMHRLLFEPALLERVLDGANAGRILFTAEQREAKRERIAGLAVRAGRLEGHGTAMDFTPETVVAGLEAHTLCPGLLPVFASLTFLNDFQCLGSFEQVEYLGRFGRALDAAGWPAAGQAARASTGALTTGRLLGGDGRPFYPLDALLGTPLEPPAPGTTMGTLITPLLPRLVE